MTFSLDLTLTCKENKQLTILYAEQYIKYVQIVNELYDKAYSLILAGSNSIGKKLEYDYLIHEILRINSILKSFNQE